MAEQNPTTLTSEEEKAIWKRIKPDAKKFGDLSTEEKQAFEAQRAEAMRLKSAENIEISDSLQKAINDYAEKTGEMTSADMSKKGSLLENLAGSGPER
jgi:hypothetical protein